MGNINSTKAEAIKDKVQGCIRNKSTELNLSSMELREYDFDIEQALAFLSNHPEITTLNLSSNNIGNEGAQALARNSTITTLNIGWNIIGNEGAQALAGNSTITTLDLSYNNIGNEGAQALAGSSTITTLNLALNNIGNEGAQALAGNSTITTLNLAINNIGKEGAQALAGNSTLTKVTLHGNDISDDEKKKLTTAFAANRSNAGTLLQHIIENNMNAVHTLMQQGTQPYGNFITKHCKDHFKCESVLHLVAQTGNFPLFLQFSQIPTCRVESGDSIKFCQYIRDKQFFESVKMTVQCNGGQTLCFEKVDKGLLAFQSRYFHHAFSLAQQGMLIEEVLTGHFQVNFSHISFDHCSKFFNYLILGCFVSTGYITNPYFRELCTYFQVYKYMNVFGDN